MKTRKGGLFQWLKRMTQKKNPKMERKTLKNQETWLKDKKDKNRMDHQIQYKVLQLEEEQAEETAEEDSQKMDTLLDKMKQTRKNMSTLMNQPMKDEVKFSKLDAKTNEMKALKTKLEKAQKKAQQSAALLSKKRGDRYRVENTIDGLGKVIPIKPFRLSNQSKNSTCNQVDLHKMMILPCLQEPISSRYFVEPFQQPGEWKNNKIKPLFRGRWGQKDAEENYNTYWKEHQHNVPREFTDDPARLLEASTAKLPAEISKHDALEIPHFSPYGFTGDCIQMSCKAKWVMYTKFFMNNLLLCQKEGPHKEGPHAVLMVTHNSRLKSTKQASKKRAFGESKQPLQDNFVEGLLPIHGEGTYANAFCLRIKIHGHEINATDIEIVCPGFSNKDPLNMIQASNDQNKNEDKNDADQFNNELYQLGLSNRPVSSNYITDKRSIQLSPMISGINQVLTTYQNFKPNMVIYLINHGNATHEAPKQSVPSQLDATLSPLGMIQSAILGKKLTPELKDKHILLCTSYLERTQMTGLILLRASNTILDTKVYLALKRMIQRALYLYDYKDMSLITRVYITYRHHLKGNVIEKLRMLEDIRNDKNNRYHFR